jgi:hypothetical protein
MAKLFGWFGSIAAPRNYLFRWIGQVGRQLWSFGRDQIVGLVLAVLILLY